jgi:hypothetical protein
VLGGEGSITGGGVGEAVGGGAAVGGTGSVEMGTLVGVLWVREEISADGVQPMVLRSRRSAKLMFLVVRFVITILVLIYI